MDRTPPTADPEAPKAGWRLVGGGRLQAADPRVGGAQPGELLGAPGEALLYTLLSPPGITLGSAICRNPEVVAQIRKVPEVGEVRLSGVGGSFGPSGPDWLELAAVVSIPSPLPRPLDRLTEFLQGHLERALGLSLELGRISGAWCPGFSDLSIEGRKLAGLGFKLSGSWATVRAVVSVKPMDDRQFQALDLCHRLQGEGLKRSSLLSLSELRGGANIGWEDAEALLLGAASGRSGKIAP